MGFACEAGVEGLIHVSEMSWSQHLRNPSDFMNVGDEMEAVVLTLDRDERKMSLGIKQLTEDPWTKQDMLSKYAIGTTHKGVVRNLTNFGCSLSWKRELMAWCTFLTCPGPKRSSTQVKWSMLAMSLR
mgnify:CR=1 FL=1